MPPKSILKNKSAAGPSRPSGSKGKVTASVSKPKAKVQIQKPDKELASEDDNDFGDEEMDTEDEIEASHATEVKSASGWAVILANSRT